MSGIFYFGTNGQGYLLVGLVVAWAISTVLASFVTDAKGRGFGEGIMFGLIGGPLGLIATVGLPEQRSKP
jgi:hypothetical protein